MPLEEMVFGEEISRQEDEASGWIVAHSRKKQRQDFTPGDSPGPSAGGVRVEEPTHTPNAIHGRAKRSLDLDSSLANALAAAPHTAPREKLRMAVLLSLSIVRTPGERAAKAIAISSAWLALRVRTLHDVTILPVVAATAAAT
ncbi:hypothetical protein MRX96_039203 [Rhipicephalus microplus]